MPRRQIESLEKSKIPFRSFLDFLQFADPAREFVQLVLNCRIGFRAIQQKPLPGQHCPLDAFQPVHDLALLIEHALHQLLQ